jgi:hypothetical protein
LRAVCRRVTAGLIAVGLACRTLFLLSISCVTYGTHPLAAVGIYGILRQFSSDSMWMSCSTMRTWW